MKYNVGDKIKIVHSDFPTNVPVGTITEVESVKNRTQSLTVYSTVHKSGGWTFNFHEVEPYQESVKSTTMNNKYNLQVGDVIDTTNSNYHPTSATDTVTDVNEALNTINFSVSKVWALNRTVERINNGTWKIVSQVSKMSDKIEVGDTVEIINNEVYQSRIKVGHRATVLELKDSGHKLEFSQHVDNGEPLIQWAISGNSDIKLVSKAKQNMKEVIGYNIKPEFKAKSAKIALALDCHDNKSTSVPFYPVTNTTITQKAKDLGTFELWFEPVYKSSEIVVKLSKSRTATIISKTVCIITLSDDTKFMAPSEAIAKVLIALDNLPCIAGYKPKFKEFELGCQTFTIDDLYAVNQAFVDFK